MTMWDEIQLSSFFTQGRWGPLTRHLFFALWDPKTVLVRRALFSFIYLQVTIKKKGESPFLPSTINNKIHRLFLTSLSTISLFLYFCESEASEEEEEVLWAAKQWRNRARTTRSCVWPAKLRSMRAERSRRWSCRSASPRAAGYGENPAAWVATWPNLGFSQSPVRDPFPSFFFSPAIRIIFFFIYLFVCHFGI